MQAVYAAVWCHSDVQVDTIIKTALFGSGGPSEQAWGQQVSGRQVQLGRMRKSCKHETEEESGEERAEERAGKVKSVGV
ncbi:unnamed protein product [Protopolystoma xenopodis]|uniref:Uncharacterized protein n=1 Tax=Protopolystoma xenopodis TaxID=117903 RepID=A0A448X4E8_9PLAT|nr:unnamed protein product [Protopolystoma xenopodis]